MADIGDVIKRCRISRFLVGETGALVADAMSVHGRFVVNIVLARVCRVFGESCGFSSSSETC
jgi:hypothetical protein